jgi:transposase-like protein
MMYLASEKLEIIRLVEQSHLPAKQTLDKLGIPRTTFYRWCDKYLDSGPEALQDRSPKPLRVWSRIPDAAFCSKIPDYGHDFDYHYLTPSSIIPDRLNPQ